MRVDNAETMEGRRCKKDEEQERKLNNMWGMVRKESLRDSGAVGKVNEHQRGEGQRTRPQIL